MRQGKWIGRLMAGAPAYPEGRLTTTADQGVGFVNQPKVNGDGSRVTWISSRDLVGMNALTSTTTGENALIKPSSDAERAALISSAAETMPALRPAA